MSLCPFFAIATRGRNTVGDGLLGVEAVQQSTRQYREIRGIPEKKYSRSLLSGETLEEDSGVLVDLQVVHGAGIGRAGVGIRPALLASDAASSRDGVTAEGLHDCNVMEERNRRGEG